MAEILVSTSLRIPACRPRMIASPDIPSRDCSERETTMTPATTQGTALITGASSGIGAVYADRLAKRGYDLILVARNAARLSTVANRVIADTGRSVKTIAADL